MNDIIYHDTDSVKEISGIKQGNFSIGYITRFKREWEMIVTHLRKFPQVNNIPLVPEDRHHEKFKRIKV